MAWTNTNPVAIGGATKKSDYDAAFDNGQLNRDSVGDFSAVIVGAGVIGTSIYSRDATTTGIAFPSANLMDFDVSGSQVAQVRANGLLFANGAVGTPSIGALTEDDTGIYFTASAMNVAIDGAKKAEFYANGIKVVDGDVGTPALAALTEINTGIYFDPSVMDVAIDGVQKAQFYANGLLSADGAVGTPGIGFLNGSKDNGWYIIATDNIGMTLNGTNVINYGVANVIYSNALKLSTGGEASPDVDLGGLCLNQGTNDANILTFKSPTDVAHGMTVREETDTYASFKKIGASGGIAIEGLSTTLTSSFQVRSAVDTEVTTKVGGSGGNIYLSAALKDGTGLQNHAGDANLLVIADLLSARFIFEADGDMHIEGGYDTFDSHDDAVACQDLTYALSGKEHLHKIIKYNKEQLHDMKVITYTPKEKSKSKKDEIFMSLKGILGLYGGGIGELYGVIDLALKEIGLDYKKLKNKYRKNQLSKS